MAPGRSSAPRRSHALARTVRRARRLAVLPALAVATLSQGCATFHRSASGGPPMSFLRLATEGQTTRTVAVGEGLGKAGAWRVVTDYLSAKYALEVRDPNAGFAMTAWETPVSRAGVPDLRYRTRLVVNFLGEDWRHLQVRAEANWRTDEGWDIGVDRELLAASAAELEALLTKR